MNPVWPRLLNFSGGRKPPNAGAPNETAEQYLAQSIDPAWPQKTLDVSQFMPNQPRHLAWWPPIGTPRAKTKFRQVKRLHRSFMSRTWTDWSPLQDRSGAEFRESICTWSTTQVSSISCPTLASCSIPRPCSSWEMPTVLKNGQRTRLPFASLMAVGSWSMPMALALEMFVHSNSPAGPLFLSFWCHRTSFWAWVLWILTASLELANEVSVLNKIFIFSSFFLYSFIFLFNWKKKNAKSIKEKISISKCIIFFFQKFWIGTPSKEILLHTIQKCLFNGSSAFWSFKSIVEKLSLQSCHFDQKKDNEKNKMNRFGKKGLFQLKIEQ